MKVKITRGYYGYRNGKASELKDVNSPAFELDEKEAERIIGLGIAKAVSVTNSNAPDEDITDMEEELEMDDSEGECPPMLAPAEPEE